MKMHIVGERGIFFPMGTVQVFCGVKFLSIFAQQAFKNTKDLLPELAGFCGAET